MLPDNDDPFDFVNKNKSPGGRSDPHVNLIESLLYEIIRVKKLIIYYESMPGGTGKLGASILQELVSEAHASLVNYDVELMKKYFDILQNCD